MRPNERADRDLATVEAPAMAQTTQRSPSSGPIAVGGVCRPQA